LYIVIEGIQDIVRHTTSDIEAVLPGHYETYKLLPSGKVQLKERKQYHKISTMPVYKTLVTPAGKSVKYGW
jgi:hypothetical protein